MTANRTGAANGTNEAHGTASEPLALVPRETSVGPETRGRDGHSAPESAQESAPESAQVSAHVVVRNRKGLHARASAKFVKCAETFDADVIVEREGQTVGGTSIMGLMMLAAGPGSVLAIRAEGPAAAAALAALVDLVEDGFGEDCVDD
jgi:phosphocarrier protein HPr